jgi:hypothetical protein
MSWVTDVLLTISVEERLDDDTNKFLKSCEALDNINAWLKQGEHGKLDELSIHAKSGGKSMQCYVYGGAFNYMKVDEFVTLVLSQTWKQPESVMLLIKDENDETFTVHQIT